MKNYRLTVLTPLLVGDGQKLSPIDYMVWKDQVNVLDQRRIFRLLAKGPRLDTYLNQIRKAERLDFASWGGYAQNYATRRIPFEHPSCALYYARTSPEHLFIPTFAGTPTGGIYVPATAIKGPLRTAFLIDRASEGQWKDFSGRLAALERTPRSPAEGLETSTLGASGISRTRPMMIADTVSLPPGGATRVYLIRTSTILQRGNKLELGWKMSPRGAVEARRPTDSTPMFAEMAVPGTVFQGTYQDSPAMASPEMLRALRWKEPAGARRFAQAANAAAAKLLETQRKYAETTGLTGVLQSLEQLSQRLAQMQESNASCLVCLGWGTGFLSKSASIDVDADPFRQILRSLPFYSQPLRSGLPFPKTRRVVFVNDQPAALPGWAELAFETTGNHTEN
ncbi:RAMP superfamily CRISPR-associated protein [uncultured Paludibaculum sp.]|uniref:RAMP superfamily CRISPR-associated protein n=1 Tax=uncultured Paludibaculum sp. TaxID=1765020 RepID=UPI002AAB1569|nr:RAMP superfamily CRISPR-associated protein [uncultured Paludibaculum sp.]